MACGRLRLGLDGRQRWPLRSPDVERVIVICSRAAADRVKRKLVPRGAALAEIAVALGATRKRLLLNRAFVITGGWPRG